MEAYEFKGKDIQWLTMMINLLQGSCSNINSNIRDKHILYMYVIQEIISRNVSISITEKISLLFTALKLSHNFASFRRPKNFCSSVSAQFAENQTWLITHFQLRSVALAAFSCWNSIEIFHLAVYFSIHLRRFRLVVGIRSILALGAASLRTKQRMSLMSS